MVIGFFLALGVFGSLTYFLTRGVMTYAYQTEKFFWGAVLLFFTLLTGLSLGSFAMMAAGSMLGISLTLGIDALVSSTTSAQAGMITLIGAFLIGLLNLVSIFVGPAGAFLTAKLVAVTALVAAVAKLDEKHCLTWLPIAAVVVATWCMWPFTACLTLGL